MGSAGVKMRMVELQMINRIEGCFSNCRITLCSCRGDPQGGASFRTPLAIPPVASLGTTLGATSLCHF